MVSEGIILDLVLSVLNTRSSPFLFTDIGAYFEAGVWLRHNILSAGMVAAQEFAKVVSLPLFVSNLTREEISFSFRTTTAPAVLMYISSFSSDYIAFLLRPDGECCFCMNFLCI